MPKNIVQDVLPPSRKTVRNIPLPRSSSVEVKSYPEEPSPLAEDISSRKFGRGNSGKRRGSSFDFSKVIIWILGMASVVAVFVVLGNVFSGAELTVTPKTRSIPIDLDLIAKPEVSEKNLAYTSLTLLREKEVSIPADFEKSVETVATGKIIIYNNYSSAVQRLVKNTRFETPNGLIYKIHDSITIPGKSAISGKIIPGSIEVTVYAESAGAEYNIGLTDFTIPGFKSNADRFAGFYARSKTPMTGGKVGIVKSISNEKRLEAKARLEGELKQVLLEEARKQAPPNAIFYDGAYRLSFEEIAGSGETVGEFVKLKERARFTAFFFSKDGIARAIASKSIDGYDGSPVAVSNYNELLFDFTNKNEYGATSVGPIELNLKGNAMLVWQFDQAKFKNDLLGKKRNELPGIISKYPNIIKAGVVIRPIWKNTFPTSVSKIKIVIEN